MFAKVFEQIFDSSIALDYTVRHMFIDLLILADPTGAVDMTYDAISRRTNVPEATIRRCIGELCQPDVNSRSPLEDGKRLMPLDSHRDWGWKIVNYHHYRKIRDQEARRSYFRDYQRKRRKKLKVVKDNKVNTVNTVEPSSSTSSSTSSSEKEDKKKSTAVRTRVNGLIDSEWIASLKQDKTYTGIDVDRELGKMQNWCKVRGLTASRRRFVSWLNRDRPISDQPHISPQHRQNRINFFNEKKQKLNRLIKDPQNPPPWIVKELAEIDSQLRKL